jgi:hypothetical protein
MDGRKGNEVKSRQKEKSKLHKRQGEGLKKLLFWGSVNPGGK